MKTYNLKITIKSLCLFEKLTDIPFSKFQDNEENILPMLYCVLVSHPENDIHMSYEEALKNLFTEKNMLEMAPQLQTQIAFYNQFGNVSGMLRPETVDSSTADSSTGTEDKGMYINDIIPILVSDCGLSIEYVMNELFYTDIEKYMVYRRQKEQARMEDQRF